MSNILEYQNWGWNAIIVSSFATIILAFLQYRLGIWNQYLTIKKANSVKSISAGWHGYFTFLFVTIGVYGWHHHSVAMVFNSILATGHFLIFWEIIRRRKMTKTEKSVIAIAVCMPFAMGLSPWKESMLLVANIGNIFSLSMQSWTIWRNQDAGEVDSQLLLVYLVATIFWVVYSFAIGAWAMEIITTVFLCLISLTYWLSIKYSKGGCNEIQK